MTRNTVGASKIVWLTLGAIVISYIFSNLAFAQQNNNGTGAGDQDRSRLQDPSQIEPAQQQVQTRDQDMTNQTGVSQGSGDEEKARTQEKEQTKSQTQTQDSEAGTPKGDGEQPKTQERVQTRVTSSEGLEQFIQQQNQLRSQEQSDNTEEKSRLRDRAKVAIESIQAAENLLGKNGQRMVGVALEVDISTQKMTQQEEKLQQRSWLRTFLFGQDKEAAGAMQQEAEQNQVRIQEMNQLLTDCGECDGEVKTMLSEQLQTMLQDQERMEEVAEEAMGRNGILGWLFN